MIENVLKIAEFLTKCPQEPVEPLAAFSSPGVKQSQLFVSKLGQVFDNKQILHYSKTHYLACMLKSVDKKCWHQKCDENLIHHIFTIINYCVGYNQVMIKQADITE